MSLTVLDSSNNCWVLEVELSLVSSSYTECKKVKKEAKKKGHTVFTVTSWFVLFRSPDNTRLCQMIPNYHNVLKHTKTPGCEKN